MTFNLRLHKENGEVYLAKCIALQSLTTESMVNMSETEVNVKVLPFVSVNSCVFFAL